MKFRKIKCNAQAKKQYRDDGKIPTHVSRKETDQPKENKYADNDGEWRFITKYFEKKQHP